MQGLSGPSLPKYSRIALFCFSFNGTCGCVRLPKCNMAVPETSPPPVAGTSTHQIPQACIALRLGSPRC